MIRRQVAETSSSLYTVAGSRAAVLTRHTRNAGKRCGEPSPPAATTPRGYPVPGPPRWARGGIGGNGPRGFRRFPASSPTLLPPCPLRWRGKSPLGAARRESDRQLSGTIQPDACRSNPTTPRLVRMLMARGVECAMSLHRQQRKHGLRIAELFTDLTPRGSGMPIRCRQMCLGRASVGRG